MAEFKPDWTLTPNEQLQVTLNLALNKHVPNWPGCTDEQLEAVAAEVLKAIAAAVASEREACARTAEDYGAKIEWGKVGSQIHERAACRIAAAIRARGQGGTDNG